VRIQTSHVFSAFNHIILMFGSTFLPLKCIYVSYSAAGKTIGAFHRRDSRGDDCEILTARLIDRALRPVLPEGWKHETQVGVPIGISLLICVCLQC
jgi:polyribonucleotide nucleotidyltransferase